MKTRRFLFLLLPLSILLTQCKKEEIPEKPEPAPKIYSLPFYVYEAWTNEPLPDVDIYHVTYNNIFNPEGSPVLLGTTDKDGFFEWKCDSACLAMFLKSGAPGDPGNTFRFIKGGFSDEDIDVWGFSLETPESWPEKVEVFMDKWEWAQGWIQLDFTFTGQIEFDKVHFNIQAPSDSWYVYPDWKWFEIDSDYIIEPIPGNKYSMTFLGTYGHLHYMSVTLYKQGASPWGGDELVYTDSLLSGYLPAWDTLQFVRTY